MSDMSILPILCYLRKTRISIDLIGRFSLIQIRVRWWTVERRHGKRRNMSGYRWSGTTALLPHVHPADKRYTRSHSSLSQILWWRLQSQSKMPFYLALQNVTGVMTKISKCRDKESEPKQRPTKVFQWTDWHFKTSTHKLWSIS